MFQLIAGLVSHARVDWETEEYVTAMPCCSAELRLDIVDVEPELPTAVLCDGFDCQNIWTVEFLDGPTDDTAVTAWRLVMCRYE